jgi:sterol desaturase/sphingolipid hydroxylase (fatty acid hydroxylase superfamily)
MNKYIIYGREVLTNIGLVHIYTLFTSSPKLQLILSILMCYVRISMTATNGYSCPKLKHNYVRWDLLLIAFNMFISYVVVSTFLGDTTNSSTSTSIIQLAFYLVVFDVVYYPLHIFLHHPSVYSSIHLIHHKAEVRYGLDLFYMHPIEMLVTVYALFAGALLWPPSSALFVVYLVTIAVGNSMWSHISIFHDSMPDPVHYLHHKYHNCNYGNIFMDHLFKTYRNTGY